MKAIAAFFSVLLVVIPQDQVLYGTWRMVPERYGSGPIDTVFVSFDSSRFRYLVIRRLPEARQLRDTVVQVVEASGRYTLVPDRSNPGWDVPEARMWGGRPYRLCLQFERPRRRPPQCSSIEMAGSSYYSSAGARHVWVPEGLPERPGTANSPRSRRPRR